jgi:lysophospholipase L1-like esterase
MSTGGIVGIGDSITASCGFPTGNLPLASWAQWVARALGEPVELFARPGATTGEIRRDLLPPEGRQFRLALIYVGTNDILKGHPVDTVLPDLTAVLDRAAKIALQTIVLTPPLWLGSVPTIAPYGRRLRRIYSYGSGIRSVADCVSAKAVQAPELHGPRYMAPDRVHPTAAGQIAFAEAAVWALRDLGWDAPLPSSLVAQADPVTIAERRSWIVESAQQAIRLPPRTLARRLLRR